MAIWLQARSHFCEGNDPPLRMDYPRPALLACKGQTDAIVYVNAGEGHALKGTHSDICDSSATVQVQGRE